MGLGGFKGQPALDGADRLEDVGVFEPDDFVGHWFLVVVVVQGVSPAMSRPRPMAWERLRAGIRSEPLAQRQRVRVDNAGVCSLVFERQNTAQGRPGV